MSLYAGAILLTELLMAAMVLHVMRHTSFTREEKAWYLLTFCSVMLCAGAEFLSRHLDGRAAPFALPLTVITVIQFSLAPMLPVFFIGALGMQSLAKKASAVFALHAGVEIVSAFFGWIFFFDAGGTYVRGGAYIIYEAFYLISLLFLIVSLMFVGRRFQHRDRLTIVMVLVIMVAAILPLLLFKIYTDYLGIGICACLCYIYYNDLIQADLRSELVEEQKRISRIQAQIISSMANLIESRDMETGEHVARTSRYVRTLAEKCREDGVYADLIDDRFIEMISLLAPMHDIGKIVVPDSILKKPGRLTEGEFQEMKRHASEGGKVIGEVLRGITDEDYLHFASDIAAYHHERWEGRGYPAGLKGEEIPLASRIMAIADVYDALISERCYKKPMSREEAIRIIREESGTHFDPRIAEVFLRHQSDFV